MMTLIAAAVGAPEVHADSIAVAREALLDYVHGTPFKRLLSDVGAAQHERGFQSIAVLSRETGEGKTFLVSVLALGYATFLRRRVLILDSIAQNSTSALYLERLFHGEFHERAAAPLAPHGMIDVVTSRAVAPHEGNGAGADAPNFRGADFAIGEFIERVKSDYDLILVDTCALEGANRHSLDPVVVARQTDTSIVVTSPATLRREALQSIGRELRRRNVSVLGTVYNERG